MAVDTEVILELLTQTFGKYCKEVTGKKIVKADDNIVPKVNGEFILVDLTSVDSTGYEANEWTDGTQREAAVVTHNFTVTYTLTAYRGKPVSVLSKLLQSFTLPYLYDKYFPLPSPFAFSSASTISRLRVPLDLQTYETRATMLVTFNVCFVEADTDAFEQLEELNAQLIYYFPEKED